MFLQRALGNRAVARILAERTVAPPPVIELKDADVQPTGGADVSSPPVAVAVETTLLVLAKEVLPPTPVRARGGLWRRWFRNWWNRGDPANE
jgi:hypothetical protein